MGALSLAQELVRCPSVTPAEAGALQLLEEKLTALGFQCTRLDSGDVSNLYARLGEGGPHLGFAGHTDVVPVGNEEAWSVPPFEGLVQDDTLWGRGTADMKTAIACFVTAVEAYLDLQPLKGSLTFIITGDEEGPAIHGTQHMLKWMVEHDQIPDLCLIGEPACAEVPGDQIKVGRRGSLTGTLTCYGKQGHIAYPHLADNPIPRLINTLQALEQMPLDEGDELFQASNLEITSVDVGNLATNIIPHESTARFGVRFNTLQNGDDLEARVRDICQQFAGDHKLEIQISGEAFLNTDSEGIEKISCSIEATIGEKPVLSTRGGTSDGRFLIQHCPVIELGMTEKTMHQIDEHVPLAHIEQLTNIYIEILKNYF